MNRIQKMRASGKYELMNSSERTSILGIAVILFAAHAAGHRGAFTFFLAMFYTTLAFCSI
jgi:hypothetical protein